MRFLPIWLVLLTIIGVQAKTNDTTLHFVFHGRENLRYSIQASQSAQWISAVNLRTHEQVQMGSRVAIKLARPEVINELLQTTSLTLSKTLTTNLFILAAPDALTAAQEAAQLSTNSEVLACSPITRNRRQVHSDYAFQPNDRYFQYAWHLEHRFAPSAGVDLNVRSAWGITRGKGVIVAFADDGVEYTHPELSARSVGMPHYNFVQGTTNGLPTSSLDLHATAVAGLAVAEYNNDLGACGVAPEANLASWKIIDNTLSADDEQYAEMFLYCNDSVAVQNHSWGFSEVFQKAPSLVESEAILTATHSGRQGKGVVMVRSVGNNRKSLIDANDSGLNNNPDVIIVAATWGNGRAASYSSPGASLLVAAPGGDTADPTGLTLFTTDRQGVNGYNYALYRPPYDTNLSDYCFGNVAFSGTSASAPLISGVAALILSANTNLSIRDVQQILILSSRHFDFDDPDLTTNGAGLRVSHNVGFGIPDAGMAVRLAQAWVPRPAQSQVTLSATNLPSEIPDDGLRVIVSDGTNEVFSFAATPSMGIQADNDTEELPLVDVGSALAPIGQDLTNKVALIQRGNNSFSDKIQFAANAGASFAIVYDNTNENRFIMGQTDFSPIPAVLISQNDGDTLSNTLITNQDYRARIHLNSQTCSFMVTNTLLCEHVALRLNLNHPSRGDIRITLTSPQGTRSILGRINQDTNACGEWTYLTTHHFFESTYGVWTLAVSDEISGQTGTIRAADLILYGTEITDTDHDGLDDAWEMAHFGSLAWGPKDDPDGDGYSNTMEQLMGTDPTTANAPFRIGVTAYDSTQTRFSWPSVATERYEVLSGSNLSALTVITNLPGKFPETDWISEHANTGALFFRVRKVTE